MPMGNFYLLNRHEGWAAVCISKNACTSLKAAVLAACGVHLEDKAAIHARIGFDARSAFLSSVARGGCGGYLHFAVWRDPLDRFLSAWRHFALERHPGVLASWPVDLDAWIERAGEELAKPVLEQDEHLRRQSDYFHRRDIDDLIELPDLDRWFGRMGWRIPPRFNASRNPAAAPSDSQRQAIRRLYAADLELPRAWIGQRG